MERLRNLNPYMLPQFWFLRKMEVVDYRKLNSVTGADKYSLEIINDITTLDLKACYHQVSVRLEDKTYAVLVQFATLASYLDYNALHRLFIDLLIGLKIVYPIFEYLIDLLIFPST